MVKIACGIIRHWLIGESDVRIYKSSTEQEKTRRILSVRDVWGGVLRHPVISQESPRQKLNCSVLQHEVLRQDWGQEPLPRKASQRRSESKNGCSSGTLSIPSGGTKPELFSIWDRVWISWKSSAMVAQVLTRDCWSVRKMWSSGQENTEPAPHRQGQIAQRTIKFGAVMLELSCTRTLRG